MDKIRLSFIVKAAFVTHKYFPGTRSLEPVELSLFLHLLTIMTVRFVNKPDSHNGQSLWQYCFSSCLSIMTVRFVRSSQKNVYCCKGMWCRLPLMHSLLVHMSGTNNLIFILFISSAWNYFSDSRRRTLWIPNIRLAHYYIRRPSWLRMMIGFQFPSSIHAVSEICSESWSHWRAKFGELHPNISSLTAS